MTKLCTYTTKSVLTLPMNFIYCGFLFLLLLCQSQPANADCVASTTSPNMGNRTSYEVYNSSFEGSGLAGMRCTSLVLLSLLSANKLNATLLTPASSMVLTHTTDATQKIGFRLYGDATPHKSGSEFVTGNVIDYAGTGLLGLLLVGTTMDAPIYLAPLPTTNVRAGLYQGSVTIRWDYKLCTGLAGVLGACLGTWIEAVKTTTANISLTVASDCSIKSTPPVNFNSYALISQFQSVSQTVTLSCTALTGYNTYFTTGDNYSGGWRRMKNGTSNFLQYHIYNPLTSAVWDINSKQAGIGTGLTQSISYIATINPNQPEKPAGAYADRISFVIEY